MSDSYVVSRAGTAVKRRKPPKEPGRWNLYPWWVSGYLTLHFAVAYALSASGKRTLDAALFGLCVLIEARELWTWWSWRRWTRYTGHKHPELPLDVIDRVFRALGYGWAAYFIVSDVLRYVLHGLLPGQPLP